MLTRLCLLTLALGACAAPDDDTADRRRRPDGAVPVVDAGALGSGGSSGSLGGTVSCYRENTADATCSAPSVCCFSNYSSAHSGWCDAPAATCGWGTIRCDGPEDCGAGQHCCAHAIVLPDWGKQGYLLACQAEACGAPPLDHEMCHPGGTCSNGKTCVPAPGTANDLPRTLYVCR